MAGLCCWSVIRASDQGFLRVFGAAVIAVAIGTASLRALGWPEVISIDRRAVGTPLFWGWFAIGVTWGLVRGAQGFRAALKAGVDMARSEKNVPCIS